MKRVVILGGGTGGTLTANRLRRLFRSDAVEITVVDQDDEPVYRPGLLFVPFRLSDTTEIVRPSVDVDVDVDGEGARRIGYDGREAPFDLALDVPLHGGAPYLGDSPGLGDELNFMPTGQGAAVGGRPEHLRHRRRGHFAHLEDRSGDPLRGRRARRERAALPVGRAARRNLRRSRQLLRRDRVPQGPVDRLRLRQRAFRCSRSRGSTTSASSCSRGSSGRTCCPGGTCQVPAPTCRAPQGPVQASLSSFREDPRP